MTARIIIIIRCQGKIYYVFKVVRELFVSNELVLCTLRVRV